MPTVVTTNQLGVDLFAAYDAISASSPETPAHPHEYGKRVTGNDSSEWIFAKVTTGATINQNEAVGIDRAATDARPLVRGTGNTTRTLRPGVYQGSQQLTAGMAAWFMISGAPQVKIIGATQPGATLYTSDTSGVLTGTAAATGSQFPVAGMIATVTASGTTASAVTAIMTFPTIGSLAGGATP